MALENVDRGIFQQLRRRVVLEGYLPDIKNYVGGTAEDYVQAKVTLKEGLPDKTLIEVFGIGSSDSREEKTDCKIVVDRVGMKKGDVSYTDEVFYVANANNKFDKMRMPDTAFDVEYEVRIIGNTAKFDRIMHNIVFYALGSKKYIKFVDDDGEDTVGGFLLMFTGFLDITKDKFIERLFRFTAKNVFLTDAELIKADVPKLTQVKVNVVAVSRLDNLNDPVVTQQYLGGKSKVTFDID